MESEDLIETPTDDNSEGAVDILLNSALISKPAPSECLKGAQLILGALGESASTLLQVGNYCRIHNMTFSKYHSLITENRASLEEAKPELKLADRTRNVYGSITILYQSLGESEQTFLKIISFYDSLRVSLDFFRVPVEGNFEDTHDLLPRDQSHQECLQDLRRTLSPDSKWDKSYIKGLIDTLQSLGLVVWSSSEEDTFRIKSQTHSWLRDTLSSTERIHYLHMAKIILTSHANVRDIRLHPKLIGHINKLRSNELALHPNDATALAEAFSRKHFYAEELELRRVAHAECLELVGPEHWSTSYTAFHLVDCSFRASFQADATNEHSTNLTRYVTRDEYVSKMRQAVKSLEKAIGKEHDKTLDCSYRLAEGLHWQGRDDEAEPCLRMVLESEKESHGPESYRYLMKSAALCRVLHHQSKYEEAATLYQQILPVMRRTIGDKALITLRTSTYYSKTLIYQNRHKEAVNSLKETLDALIELLGKKGWDTIVAARALACCLVRLKRWAEAEEVLKWMLETTESEYGYDYREAVKGRELKEAITRHYEKQALKTPKARMIAVSGI